MKELIDKIHEKTRNIVTPQQWKDIEPVLIDCLSMMNQSVNPKDIYEENIYYLDMYLADKNIEGCSDKTLRHYQLIIEKLLKAVDHTVPEITTSDIRKYLSDYQKSHKVSRVTMDNIRRVICGFFSWLEDEDYVVKSPARRIHKVKSDKVVKETFSDENIETLRNACDNVRDLAIIEFLSSTGVRVGELVGLDRQDINFVERSCIVLGKGNKEREVYFDARTKLHLEEYLATRNDDNNGLFVGNRAPYNRMTISGIEKCLHRIGKRCKIHDVHPHKFRRTLATMAIDKGMPVEQVQTLLGHVRIDTTMHYAMVNQQNVKASHRKYIE